MPALFVDHLTVMDFTRIDPARGLVGESWIVDVVLEGALDDNGMVFDFGDVKKQIKRTIDESFDHKLVVPRDLAGLSITGDGDAQVIGWTDHHGERYEHQGPQQATAILPGTDITPEGSTRWLESLLHTVVPANVDRVRLVVRNEVIDGACYHYTHGLKKHGGNCQRIAHGHRSRLEIRLDGMRQPALEATWAERWRDIYIGTREDVQAEDGSQLHFAYDASQGHYALSLPRRCVYLIETDSTVEWIAEHLAATIADAHPGREVEVRAFEGVWKGAIARR